MYETFYKFSDRPFQLTPDPDYYFESLTHKKALSYLGYGLNQGEGFVVITGEVGAGKSTLVAHLRRKLDAEQMTVGEVVTSALDGEEMILVVARSFGLQVSGNDKAAALASIEHFLHEQARGGRRTLLIVDEAQNLSIGALEELRMLSNFQLGAHPLLQTLMLGQPEFKQLLASSSELEQLRQRVIAAHHLEAMQPGEIEPYVRHRLELVGWTGDPSLDKGLYNRLHRATGGIPRKINQAMTRLLLLGAVEERHELDADALDAALADMQEAASGEEIGVASPRPDRSAPAAHAVAEARRAQNSTTSASGSGGLTDAQIDAIEQAFHQRDRELRRLREEIAGLHERAGPDSEGVAQRLQEVDERLDEQEATLKRVLSLMIRTLEANTREAA